MSRRLGHIALERIVLEYGTVQGTASPAVRHALAREIPQFKQLYPQVVIELRLRKTDAQSRLTGFYKDGSERAWNLEGLGAQGIWHRMHKLVNTANDDDVYFSPSSMMHVRSSVQGYWSPWLWLAERAEENTSTSWDRTLTESEWDYFVQRESNRLAKRETAIQNRSSPDTHTTKGEEEKLRERWQKEMAPRIQSDLEANVQAFKKGSKGIQHKVTNETDYRLFEIPDHAQLGRDAFAALRSKEHARIEQWWTERKEQLKPPE